MNRGFAPRLSLGIRGDLVYGNPFKREKCFFETVQAPVPSGSSSVTRTEPTSNVPQYSYLDVAGVVSLDAIDASRLRVRFFGGAAAVPFKPVLPVFYGVEVLPRFGRNRLAISVEQWRWNVRLDSVLYQFQDGNLQSRTARGFDAIRQPIYVRISSVSGFGGRGPR